MTALRSVVMLLLCFGVNAFEPVLPKRRHFEAGKV